MLPMNQCFRAFHVEHEVHSAKTRDCFGNGGTLTLPGGQVIGGFAPSRGRGMSPLPSLFPKMY
jgi:hypothetical protein